MKKENRRRSIQKLIRFEKSEIDFINQKVAASPFDNFQNYARIMLITGEAKLVDYSQLQKLASEVNRVGHNVNQVAKYAHLLGEVSQEDVTELLTEIKDLKQIVQETLSKELKQERVI
ncbi:plasmid mobilization relaxosome protein MobC [Pseudolactococcus yaeyamensis]